MRSADQPIVNAFHNRSEPRPSDDRDKRKGRAVIPKAHKKLVGFLAWDQCANTNQCRELAYLRQLVSALESYKLADEREQCSGRSDTAGKRCGAALTL
ncbi:MAG: hypothetical protein AAF707_05235 [Pseudomonadota bacterium]